MKNTLVGTLAIGLLILGLVGVANALTIINNGSEVNVGGYDTFIASALQKESPWFVTGNDPEDELAWINFELGTSYGLDSFLKTGSDKNDWFAVSGGVANSYAFELTDEPAYFMIKTGKNGTTSDYRYFLFKNNASIDWAVITVGLQDGYVIDNLTKISHIDQVGGAPVPEPATMLLFGTGLVGLAGTRFRRKKN